MRFEWLGYGTKSSRFVFMSLLKILAARAILSVKCKEPRDCPKVSKSQVFSQKKKKTASAFQIIYKLKHSASNCLTNVFLYSDDFLWCFPHNLITPSSAFYSRSHYYFSHSIWYHFFCFNFNLFQFLRLLHLFTPISMVSFSGIIVDTTAISHCSFFKNKTHLRHRTFSSMLPCLILSQKFL